MEHDRVVVKCVYCDKVGHRARDCPDPRVDKFACRNCKYVYLVTDSHRIHLNLYVDNPAIKLSSVPNLNLPMVLNVDDATKVSYMTVLYILSYKFINAQS